MPRAEEVIERQKIVDDAQTQIFLYIQSVVTSHGLTVAEVLLILSSEIATIASGCVDKERE